MSDTTKGKLFVVATNHGFIEVKNASFEQTNTILTCIRDPRGLTIGLREVPCDGCGIVRGEAVETVTNRLFHCTSTTERPYDHEIRCTRQQWEAGYMSRVYC